MAQLARIRVGLTGVPVVGASVMTFYATTTGSGLVAATKTFVTALAGIMPTGLALVVPSGGDLIEDTTGALAGTWAESGGATIQASNNTGFTLGVGGRIEWAASGIFGGRHLRGRTFVVPLVKGVVGADGRITPTDGANIAAAANAYVTALGGQLSIWSKPKPARQGVHGPLPAQVGGHGAVTSASVPSTPTALRSRRT